MTEDHMISVIDACWHVPRLIDRPRLRGTGHEYVTRLRQARPEDDPSWIIFSSIRIEVHR